MPFGRMRGAWHSQVCDGAGAAAAAGGSVAFAFVPFSSSDLKNLEGSFGAATGAGAAVVVGGAAGPGAGTGPGAAAAEGRAAAAAVDEGDGPMEGRDARGMVLVAEGPTQAEAGPTPAETTDDARDPTTDRAGVDTTLLALLRGCTSLVAVLDDGNAAAAAGEAARESEPDGVADGPTDALGGCCCGCCSTNGVGADNDGTSDGRRGGIPALLLPAFPCPPPPPTALITVASPAASRAAHSPIGIASPDASRTCSAGVAMGAVTAFQDEERSALRL